MWKNNLVIGFLIFFAFQLANAQEFLSLDDAVRIALKNNFDIQIAKIDSAESSLNNTIGNAGMLPKLSIIASDNNAINDINQKYSTGIETQKNAVKSSNINASAVLAWTLFDGFKMFITKEKLSALQEQDIIAIKDKIQDTLKEVITAYFDITVQQQLIIVQKESNKISEERVKIAKLKFENGSGAKTDFLQASVDLNEGRSYLLQLSVQLEQKRNILSQLLARPAEQAFTVMDSIPLSNSIDFKDIQTGITTNNLAIQSSEKSLKISQLSFKEIRSQRLPQLNLLLGYNFAYTKNAAGFMLLNQGLGPNYGLNFSLPVFNGFNLNHQIKIASLDVSKNLYMFEKIKQQINTNLINVYKNYIYYFDALKIEEENILLAKENAKISLERLKLSQATSLEMITAQNSLVNAYHRLLTTRFHAKLAEIELLRLNGKLLK